MNTSKTRIRIVMGALLALGLLAGGCTVRAGVRTRAHVNVPPPNLVEVEPGVWVVEDYHEPVFWNDGWYWRYYGGVWYRSSYHTGGWVVVRGPRVPVYISRIRTPRRYVRYRARPGVRYRSGPRGSVRVYSSRGRVQRRDHRRNVRRDNRRYRRDVRRDNRQHRRDVRRDNRQHRRDVRRDNRQRRRDKRKDRREERRDRRDNRRHR